MANNCQSHIWDKFTPKRGRYVSNIYTCRNCNEILRTSDTLPQAPKPTCVHEWVDLPHNYGSNYNKHICQKCQKTVIDMK